MWMIQYIVFGALLVILAKPADVITKIQDFPGEFVLLCVVIIGIFLFWPWRKDDRIFFQDLKDDCLVYSRRKKFCIAEKNYKGECCESKCPLTNTQSKGVS